MQITNTISFSGIEERSYPASPQNMNSQLSLSNDGAMDLSNDSKVYKLNPTTGSNTLLTSLDKTSKHDKTGFEGLSDEQDDELDNDVFFGGYITCCGSLRFFIKNACTDISRHKCQFCLAFCSVFIVVLSVIVVNSVIAKGPLIFLQIAE